jgi:hypothetical protein
VPFLLFHYKKDYFFDKKKVQFFFHARISRSGKGRVSDFSATRVRVEDVGFFLVKMGFSLPNWLFQQSFVVFDNLYTSPINLKRDNLLILARREFLVG